MTTRLVRGLPSLRSQGVYAVLRAAFAMGCDRDGFRPVRYSVQGNHLRLIVEASDRTCLSRGLQGLMVRIARTLNRLWRRAGKVFADRYHDHMLRTPREVRHALAYVRTTPAATASGWRKRSTTSPRDAGSTAGARS
ncbi:MAG: hypothetical protein H6836_02895 [Planctomycetes bacterium]|nr:hypothetical protein [Planctomycetota bacterium]